MRMIGAVLCVLLIAAPAGADEPSGAQRVMPLADLTRLIEAEIAFYETAGYSGILGTAIPGLDLNALIEQRMLYADADLGFFRSRASDLLHATLPHEAVHFLLGLDPELDAADIAARLDATDLPSDAVWAAAALAEDWALFQQNLLRLREIVEPGSPERVCPLKADTWFQNEWEVPRPWGRVHKGVDLHTELGTRLYAIEDGVVIQANWHYLGGRQVYVRADSTGDVWYYAHLDYWPKWLWTGTRLEAGDYLGLSGQSGNATTPHLTSAGCPARRRSSSTICRTRTSSCTSCVSSGPPAAISPSLSGHRRRWVRPPPRRSARLRLRRRSFPSPPLTRRSLDSWRPADRSDPRAASRKPQAASREPQVDRS